MFVSYLGDTPWGHRSVVGGHHSLGHVQWGSDGGYDERKHCSRTMH